jgi:hypothetical protein
MKFLRKNANLVINLENDIKFTIAEGRLQKVKLRPHEGWFIIIKMINIMVVNVNHAM